MSTATMEILQQIRSIGMMRPPECRDCRLADCDPAACAKVVHAGECAGCAHRHCAVHGFFTGAKPLLPSRDVMFSRAGLPCEHQH